uniref:Uncharacterized protein n=1 Tax=Lactuca sativa TaxID=4236 RepID=A0A9R1XTQ3_LACSA|nr:hypothetical protein LSAT_V11C300131300 [Lactuca sativa]
MDHRGIIVRGSIVGGRRGRRGGKEKQRSFVSWLRKPMWSPGFDGPKGRTGRGRVSARVDVIRRDGEREEAVNSSLSLPAARKEGGLRWVFRFAYLTEIDGDD